MAITETRTSDERGYMVELSSNNTQFAHYVFTFRGFARGGSSYSYEKEVKVCLGRLLCVGLPEAGKAKDYRAGATFTIPSGTPTLLIALDDFLTFTTYKGEVQPGENHAALRQLKSRVNPRADLEALLKEFGIKISD